MAVYTLANGEILTDEDIDRECAEYEAGTWNGRLERFHTPDREDEDDVGLAQQKTGSFNE